MLHSFRNKQDPAEEAMRKKAAKEIWAIRSTFDMYRKGWDMKWEKDEAVIKSEESLIKSMDAGPEKDEKQKKLDKMKKLIKNQKHEVLALLEKERKEHIKLIEEFVEHLGKKEGRDNTKSILINVDIQPSFVDEEQIDPKENIGTLGVVDSRKEALPNMVALQSEFPVILSTMDLQLKNGDPTFASTHGVEPFTEKTISFNGKTHTNVVWPDHCSNGTKGQAMHPDILAAQANAQSQNPNTFMRAMDKGGYTGVENYSGIEDQAGNRAVMSSMLKLADPEELVFNGLALDYCVQSTINHVLDMQAKGELPNLKKVVLIQDATKAVDPKAGEGKINDIQARAKAGLDIQVVTLEAYKAQKAQQPAPKSSL